MPALALPNARLIGALLCLNNNLCFRMLFWENKCIDHGHETVIEHRIDHNLGQESRQRDQRGRRQVYLLGPKQRGTETLRRRRVHCWINGDVDNSVVSDTDDNEGPRAPVPEGESGALKGGRTDHISPMPNIQKIPTRPLF